MQYNVEVRQSEPTYTAVIRSRERKEDLSKFVPAACGEVWSYFRSAGLPKPGRNLALYHGGGEVSVEAGAEVREEFSGKRSHPLFTVAGWTRRNHSPLRPIFVSGGGACGYPGMVCSAW